MGGGGGGSDIIVGLLGSIGPLHKEEFSQTCGWLHKNVHFHLLSSVGLLLKQ